MKKLLFFLQLFLIASACYSQVKFDSFIEAGYEDRIISIYDYDSPEPDIWLASNSLHNSLFATFDNRLIYKGFSLYAAVKTNARYISPVKYQPLQSEYVMGFSFTHKKVVLRIEHMCSHSIDRTYYREAYDRFSIKYQLF